MSMNMVSRLAGRLDAGDVPRKNRRKYYEITRGAHISMPRAVPAALPPPQQEDISGRKDWALNRPL